MNSQTRSVRPLGPGTLKAASSHRQKVILRATQLTTPFILVLAKPSHSLNDLLLALESRGYKVLFTTRPEEALQYLARQALDLLLVELGAGAQEGLAVVQAAQSSTLPPPVILLGYQKTPLPAMAFQLEVADYLLLPQAGSDAVRRVARALGRPHRRDRAETEAHIAALNLKALLGVKEMVAACTELLEALGRAMDLAEPHAPVITTAASEQKFRASHSGTSPWGIIDLEIPA